MIPAGKAIRRFGTISGTRLGNSARERRTSLLSGELLGEATPLFYSAYLFAFSSYQLSRQSAFQELERNPLPSALPACQWMESNNLTNVDVVEAGGPDGTEDVTP